MIFVKGWGGIAGLVIAVVIGAPLEGMGASRALAYFVGGLGMAAFGFWLHAREDERHSIFFIPVEYMGGLIAVGALVGL